MCQLSAKGEASRVGIGAGVPAGTAGIGDLFRAHGEEYIASRKLDKRTIDLIRAIRVCCTKALGGKIRKCCNCGDEQYIYFSCGHSHCPICQGNKRVNWQQNVQDRLLAVPYAHLTFTIPHDLNGLCRLHAKEMYNMLFQSAWATLKKLCAKEEYVGGLPGMTAVLHTWGSDLKYHIHLHCLVTFGGFNKKTNTWHWPKQKNKLVKFRKLRSTFKEIFLKKLKAWMDLGTHAYHQSYAVLTTAVAKKSWVVNHQPPSSDTSTISTYLARYICRIGISDKRLSYDKARQEVHLKFNNYRQQQAGEAAPTAYRTLEPLVAMDLILQHLLPAYFQRSRHYGLHSASTYKSVATKLPQLVQRTSNTVRIIIQLLKLLLKMDEVRCEHCGFSEFKETPLAPDKTYKDTFLNLPSRSPPQTGTTAVTTVA